MTRWILIAASLSMIATIVAYMVVHKSSGIGGPEAWGSFGDYFGGMLNPLIAFLALVAIVLSLKYQRATLDEAKKEVRNSAETLCLTRKEMKETAKAIEEQTNQLTQDRRERTLAYMADRLRQSFELAVEDRRNRSVNDKPQALADKVVSFVGRDYRLRIGAKFNKNHQTLSQSDVENHHAEMFADPTFRALVARTILSEAAPVIESMSAGFDYIRQLGLPAEQAQEFAEFYSRLLDSRAFTIYAVLAIFEEGRIRENYDDFKLRAFVSEYSFTADDSRFDWLCEEERSVIGV